MMADRRAFLRMASLAAAGLWLPGRGVAHHGFTGRYDRLQPIWVAGRVNRASFSPPHATLAVLVGEGSGEPPVPLPTDIGGRPQARPGDLGRELTIEFPPVRAFFDLSARLKAGDSVELIALRNCDPPHQFRSQWLRLADGTVVSRATSPAYIVNGCT